MKILVRCNAGNIYGYGHLARCITLVKALEGLGYRAFFIVKSDDEKGVIYFIEKHGITYHNFLIIDKETTQETDIHTLLEYYKNNFLFLILDHYEHDLRYQKTLLLAGIKWAQFDYTANKKLLANIIINSNISASEEMYKELVLPYTELCIGYKYAILRQDFISQVAKPEQNRVLIAMGGGKYPNQVIDLIKDIIIDDRFIFEIVTNDYLVKDITDQHKNAHIHISEIDVLPIYQKCFFAIVAGGLTSFELAILNTPFIIVPYVKNQIPNSIAWEQHSFGINMESPLNFSNKIKIDGLSNIISNAIDVYKNRKIIIDGLGSKRIANKIDKIIKTSE